MIIIFKYLIPKGYTALAMYPFVFLKSAHLKTNHVLLNHERIHLKQQLELFVVVFYVVYAFEFIYGLLCYRSWKTAYRNVSFEREAYQNEDNCAYLKSRKTWQFLKYIRAHEF